MSQTISRIGYYVIAVIILTISVTNRFEMSENLNKEVEINGDTLLIVNYSIILNTYRLSNGLRVYREVGETNIINKEDLNIENPFDNLQKNIMNKDKQ